MGTDPHLHGRVLLDLDRLREKVAELATSRPHKGREFAMVRTKLDEAGLWLLEAMHDRG